jgi:hypothetical protein
MLPMRMLRGPSVYFPLALLAGARAPASLVARVAAATRARDALVPVLPPPGDERRHAAAAAAMQRGETRPWLLRGRCLGVNPRLCSALEQQTREPLELTLRAEVWMPGRLAPLLLPPVPARASLAAVLPLSQAATSMLLRVRPRSSGARVGGRSA